MNDKFCSEKVSSLSVLNVSNFSGVDFFYFFNPGLKSALGSPPYNYITTRDHLVLNSFLVIFFFRFRNKIRAFARHLI